MHIHYLACLCVKLSASKINLFWGANCGEKLCCVPIKKRQQQQQQQQQEQRQQQQQQQHTHINIYIYTYVKHILKKKRTHIYIYTM